MLRYLKFWFIAFWGVLIGKYPLTLHVRGRMAFIGSVIGAVGSIAGGLLARNSAKDANRTAQQNAADSRLFTKEQLQNRHQWEVNDLRKAGLNPVLSAHGTPSIGGSAMAQTYNEGDNVGSIASSALQAQRLGAEIDLLKSQSKAQTAAAKAGNTQAVKNLADARNIKNIGDVTENISNLNKGFHDITDDLANSAKDVYRKKDEIIRDLKRVPSTYGSFAKQKWKEGKSWLKKKFK